jgi:hypothetical protein
LGAEQSERRFPMLAAKLLTQYFLENFRPTSSAKPKLWSALASLCAAALPEAALKEDHERFLAHLHTAIHQQSAASPFFAFAGRAPTQADLEASAAPAADVVFKALHAPKAPAPEPLRMSMEALTEILPLALYARVAGVLHLNTFSIVDRPAGAGTKAPVTVGSALFEVPSLMNHSCDNNVELVQPWQRSSSDAPSSASSADIGQRPAPLGLFRVVKDVQPGEELCVSVLCMCLRGGCAFAVVSLQLLAEAAWVFARADFVHGRVPADQGAPRVLAVRVRVRVQVPAMPVKGSRTIGAAIDKSITHHST